MRLGRRIRQSLISALDRGGLRWILAWLATHVARRGSGPPVTVFFDGFWCRRIGSDVFVDAPRFQYTMENLRASGTRAENLEREAVDCWFYVYRPKPGDVIIDVGAGRGEHLLTLSRAVGDDGLVVAIEADPVSFAMLEAAGRLNLLSNVMTLHSAAMAQPGTARLTVTESWFQNTVLEGSAAIGETVEVPGVTLDSVCEGLNRSEIDFVKMNIEGAEVDALKGLENWHPRVHAICVACHDFMADAGEGEGYRTRETVHRMLEGLGYEVTTRRDDPRPYVSDHLHARRGSQQRRGGASSPHL